jgi:hypothetical protein
MRQAEGGGIQGGRQPLFLYKPTRLLPLSTFGTFMKTSFACTVLFLSALLALPSYTSTITESSLFYDVQETFNSDDFTDATDFFTMTSSSTGDSVRGLPDSPCAIGQVRTSSGCTECPAGKYGSEGGALCLSCSVGTHQSQTGSTGCIACSPGTFSSNSRATTCIQCAPGTFSSSSYATQCMPCNVGSFSSVVGASSCTSCVPGAYAATTGASTCTLCTPGKFNANASASECISCPVQTAQSNRGATTCTACSLHSTAPDTGAIQCAPCAEGQARINALSPLCIDSHPTMQELTLPSIDIPQSAPTTIVDDIDGTGLRTYTSDQTVYTRERHSDNEFIYSHLAGYVSLGVLTTCVLFIPLLL